jgi:putative ABC transport system permease protein
VFESDLEHNRKRIALTVFAIAWGTISIVMLLSAGEGMKNAFAKGSRGMGEGIAVLWPGTTSKPYAGLPSGRAIRFRKEDVALLRERVPEIAAISAEFARFGTPISAGDENLNVRVRGVEPEFGPLRNLWPQPGGRFLNPLDQLEKRRVVFLGDKLAQDLFGRPDVVGESVVINRSPFVVIGVMQDKVMMGMYSGPDESQATIPSATYESMFTGSQPQNLVYKPVGDLGDQALAGVYRVLGTRYRFDPEDKPSLGVWDTRENQRMTDNIAIGIQVFLGIIGALTLFVGGMGIANIMYAVIKERTREIGVKMALGAKMRQVMAPFLLEALLMTLLGGILGTAIALGLIAIIGVLPLEGEAFELLGRPTFSPGVALATSLVLGAIGAFAGYFPARRAASVNPAVSLRYE